MVWGGGVLFGPSNITHAEERGCRGSKPNKNEKNEGSLKKYHSHGDSQEYDPAITDQDLEACRHP